MSPRTVYRHVTHTIATHPKAASPTRRSVSLSAAELNPAPMTSRKPRRTGHSATPDAPATTSSDGSSPTTPRSPEPSRSTTASRNRTHTPQAIRTRPAAQPGRSTDSQGVPPKRDASKLSLRLQGDPLTRVARGTAAHPACSRLRHRGPASDQAAQRRHSGPPEARRKPGAPAWRTLGRRRSDGGELDGTGAQRWGRSAPWALPTSPGRGPRRARPGGHSFKFRAGSRPARVAGPAYGPLTMPDPNPGRTPAKPHSTALRRAAV